LIELEESVCFFQVAFKKMGNCSPSKDDKIVNLLN